jgi:3-polyprenyl-4-hydroxybenzoate decarboxylase
MPATPAFYYGPQTIDDIVDQFSYRVLAQAGLPQKKQYRWKGKALKGRYADDGQARL